MPKAPPKEDLTEYAFKFIKPDIERVGLFIEMPYMNGKGYVSPFPKPIPYKGAQMMTEGRKSKNGTMHGYFDDEFRRIYEGEGLKGKRKPYKSKFKNVSKLPFVNAVGAKKHSTPGDYYGCFSGKIEYFSNERRPVKPVNLKKLKKNLVTRPGKKGGPGYADICFSKYPQHLPDPYGLKLVAKAYGRMLNGPMYTNQHPKPFFEKNPFKEVPGAKPGPVYVRPKVRPAYVIEPGYFIPAGPAKWQGGCHDGCFDPFPEYKTNRVKPKKKKPKTEEKKYFYPQAMGLVHLQTMSVMNHNTDFRVNAQNYKTYKPTYTKYLTN